MLGEALNDGSSASFEGVALLIRNFVDGGDVAFRNVALRMCVNVMMVERDSAHRRVGSSSSSSSSTAILRLQRDVWSQGVRDCLHCIAGWMARLPASHGG